MWCGTEFEDVTLCANISIIIVCSAWEDGVISTFLLLVLREKHHECGVKRCRVAQVFSTKICHIFEKLLRGDTQWTQRHKITTSCAMKCEENRAGTVSWSKTCYLLKSCIVCLNMPVCFRFVWSHFSVATEIHTIKTFERRMFIYLRSWNMLRSSGSRYKYINRKVCCVRGLFFTTVLIKYTN
jgi:hypothetical protein